MRKSEKKVPETFFLKGAVEDIAPSLLGTIVETKKDGLLCSGRIVEVEAYCGLRDQACHAFKGRTPRNEILFSRGGVAYVYLCYGIHRLLNFVSGEEGNPCGILIRAVEPLEGKEIMRSRRGGVTSDIAIGNGPGKLSQALGIELSDNGLSLGGPGLILKKGWIEKGERILTGKRIGVDYAGKDKNLPWRFALDSPYVSVSKGLRPLSESRV